MGLIFFFVWTVVYLIRGLAWGFNFGWSALGSDYLRILYFNFSLDWGLKFFGLVWGMIN